MVDESADNPSAAPSQAPAGWYPDPNMPGGQRYWDGSYWGPTSPPSGAPPAPYAAQPYRSGTNGLAIASLVLGIIWIYWIGSILAVIFGHIALNQMDRPDNHESGRGMAIAGLVLGYIGLAIIGVIIIVAIAASA